MTSERLYTAPSNATNVVVSAILPATAEPSLLRPLRSGAPHLEQQYGRCATPSLWRLRGTEPIVGNIR